MKMATEGAIPIIIQYVTDKNQLLAREAIRVITVLAKDDELHHFSTGHMLNAVLSMISLRENIFDRGRRASETYWPALQRQEHHN